MTKNFLLFTILFYIHASIFTGCTENPNRVYFTIDSKDRKIVVPVQLNDSITANLSFDSGWGSEGIYLDSTFVASHPSLAIDVLPDTSKIGSGWTSYNTVPSLGYKTSQAVKIGDTDLTLNVVHVLNWKRLMDSDVSEGVFNIPANDTTHVWEFNFEHNYLEIHPEANFKMPENCFVVPMDNNFFVQLPMQIKCPNGDTLTLNRTYLVDTAMPWDIALMYQSEELDFFNKRDDAVWRDNLNSYCRSYTVNATLFDTYTADSVRIYTFDYPNGTATISNYLIGINFLKRFNVFFDKKNRRMGLQPIKNFQRIVNPRYSQYYFASRRTPEGKYFVTHIADYKDNYYKNAGLQEGDEIVLVNGIHLKDMTYEEKIALNTTYTFVLDIIRNGKPLKITVELDKDKVVQED